MNTSTEGATQIQIYTTRSCGYCMAAKRLLEEEGLSYTETDLTGNPERRRKLIEATQKLTVPQIFIGETHIGGYTELRAARDSGQLAELTDSH